MTYAGRQHPTQYLIRNPKIQVAPGKLHVHLQNLSLRSDEWQTVRPRRLFIHQANTLAGMRASAHMVNLQGTNALQVGQPAAASKFDKRRHLANC